MTNRFDDVAAEWDQVPLRVRMAEVLAGEMIRHLDPRPGQIVMDYGTGTGLIALKLCPHVAKVVAADTSEGMLAVLREKISQAGITTIEPRRWGIDQDPDDLPGFDAVVSSMTLHHIKDTSAVARAFYRLLVPGGRIALADLDEENGDFHGNAQATEHNGFNRAALRAVFDQAGFTGLEFHDAHTVVKPLADGREKPFSIFLLTGSKPVDATRERR